MTSVLNYFARNGTAKPPTPPAEPEEREIQPTFDNKKTPIRALPAPWFTTPEFYQLERRAIFSRRWLFLTHQSRLPEVGDFLRYTIANYDIVIVRNKTGSINAFHNVCRHRGYQVVEEREGRKKIFACRYHGWSYGLDGRLAKATDYAMLEGFEREKNGLFPVHVHVDMQGFVWVNLSSSNPPEVSWEEHFETVDQQERFQQFNFDDYVLDHSYEMEGEYNWKILADNFNECYHCKTTHPDVPTFLTIDSHVPYTKDGHIQHDHAATEEQKKMGFDVNSTYYFPNASMSVSPHFMMIQKFLPSSPTNSTMHYEIFRNKNSSDEDFKLISGIYARVMSEDKALCAGQQRNLNAGVFVNGEMHPRWEKGPLFFQQTVREVVTEHFRREKEAGREIWPARQKLPDSAVVSLEDLEICEGLGCGKVKEGLVW